MEYYLCKQLPKNPWTVVTGVKIGDAGPNFNGRAHSHSVTLETAEFVPCLQWVEADAYIVGNVFPSADDGAELLAWGFMIVIGPTVLLALAVVVARSIRAFFGSR